MERTGREEKERVKARTKVAGRAFTALNQARTPGGKETRCCGPRLQRTPNGRSSLKDVAQCLIKMRNRMSFVPTSLATRMTRKRLRLTRPGRKVCPDPLAMNAQHLRLRLGVIVCLGIPVQDPREHKLNSDQLIAVRAEH